MKHKNTKQKSVREQLQRRADSWTNLPTSSIKAIVFREKWLLQARASQITPPGNWHVWLILAGRGWGKTRTGAEDMAYYALWNPGVRCSVIAPTFADARDTCIEGESGLKRCLPDESIEKWNRSYGELFLKNGSLIKCYSADQPERLRGPQHHRVWCDELGAWEKRDAFDQMWFGLRLGADPRVIVTTTPRNTEMLRDLFKRKDDDVLLTKGRTTDNADNLAPHVLRHLQEQYGGTRLGRQELDAELLLDTEGALWNRDQIDKLRTTSVPELRRVVVAIDPAMSSHARSDETGIVTAGIGTDGLLYVLSDWSGRYTPDAWAERVILLYNDMRAHVIVAEVNAGGDMVESILRQKAPHVYFKPLHAIHNKVQRAIPIAALYEQGRVRHVGALQKLEDQMCKFTPDNQMEHSPDRVDALVWALTELSHGPRGEPKIRFL